MTEVAPEVEPGMQVELTAFGEPARAALLAQVQQAKQSDSLAPVTVVVPRRVDGVELRRFLASAASGIAAVDFVTVRQLAARLVEPQLLLSGRLPLSGVAVGAAVRSALAEVDGMFSRVAEHPSTQAEFTRIYYELRGLDGSQLERLAGTSRRAAEVVGVHREVAAALGLRFYDDAELVRTARAALADEAQPSDRGTANGGLGVTERDAIEQAQRLGRVVVFLPKQLPPAEVALLIGTARHVPVTVVAALTGLADVDRPTADLLAALGHPLPHEGHSEPTGLPEPLFDQLVTVSDADDEVRHVVRSVLADIDAKVAPTDISVLTPTESVYSRILADHLNAAGVAWHGIAPQTLRESVAGRVASGLANLAGTELARDDVFNLLAVGVLRRDQPGAAERSLAPVANWERLARSAGVVGGDDWETRLTHHADHLRERAQLAGRDDEDEQSWVVARDEREASQCDALREFVAKMRKQLDSGQRLSNWADLCNWFKALLTRYLGVRFTGVSGTGDAVMTPDEWPPWEAEAARQVNQLVDQLADLEKIEPRASFGVMRSVLDTGLRRSMRLQPGGSAGVNVAPLDGSESGAPKRLYVLGLAEGVCPKRVQPNALIGNEERDELGGALKRVADANTSQHLSLVGVLQAVRSVDGGKAVGTFPRGGLRRSTENAPSRFLKGLASPHVVDGLVEGTVARAAEPTGGARATELARVASYYAGVQAATFPFTRSERDAADITRLGRRAWQQTEQSWDDGEHTALKRGWETSASRQSRRFTRFDGNLAGVIQPRHRLGDGETQVAPTTLEGWANCPRSYLFSRLLRVTDVEDPQTDLRISALDRGHLVHSALDKLNRELLARGTPPGPERPYQPSDSEALISYAREGMDHLEQTGRSGHPFYWELDCSEIKADLVEFLARDEARAVRGTVAASEHRFGTTRFQQHPDAPAVALELDNGMSVLFRGSIDRVERLDDGSLVVIDYKTGKTRRYDDLGKKGLTAGGKFLQLPVYALAAEDAFGRATTPTRAMYWFVTSRAGSWGQRGVILSEDELTEFRSVISHVVDAVNAGVFLGLPSRDDDSLRQFAGFTKCPYCDPDGLGTAGLRRQVQRKFADRKLMPLLALQDVGSDD